MPPPKIKTLLIEDSGFMRIVLSDLISRDETIEVVGTAKNGREGVEKVKSLKPDVVITDLVMPDFDGLYLVKTIMREMPLPIILLSSLDRTSSKVFDALSEGAFDFMDKPRDAQGTQVHLPLTKMIREASLTDYLKLRQKVRGRNMLVHAFEPRLHYDIIALGASTGGPGTIEFIVTNLPRNLSVPIVVAQHMPHRFIESFAERLADTTGLSVSVANDGECLLDNHIYFAPGVSNLRIKVTASCPSFAYVEDVYKEFNSPSIDCLFESVAETYGSRAIATILTGMGKDGTAGLLKIREAGGLTLAQDETSSVVYGMPKMAFESGAAMRQIPLHELPNFIVSAL